MAMRRVGVVGCGLMGRGIAQVSARAGFETVVREVSRNALEHGLAAVRADLDAGIAKGRLDAGERDATLANLRGTVELRALADCDLVVEAIVESLAAKRDLLEALGGLLGPEAIVASNTSSLSITAMSAFVRRPERFLGLHFFNPVPRMRLVELVHSMHTSPAVVEEAAAWCAAVGKTVVRCGDSTGFVVNRLLVPYLLDAIRSHEQGLASRDDLDRAMELGGGHPMGPLRLADTVGLDTLLAIAEIMFDDFKDPRFGAPPLLRRLVAAGRFGRKSGRGFYDWSTNPPT